MEAQPSASSGAARDGVRHAAESAAAAEGSGEDFSSGDENGGSGQDGAYRKRGRPRKYEGLDETERRKRRMADNRQSAKR